jgi:sodium transport system permease protein
MNWANICLILFRELRDQLRDRRTLFTVVVLPLLLYPIMGMSLFQVTQFFREQPTLVWIVGQENLPSEVPLLDGERISDVWGTPADTNLVQLLLSNQSDSDFQRLVSQFQENATLPNSRELIDQYIQRELSARKADLAVFIPKPIEPAPDDPLSSFTETAPTVYLFVNSAREQSRIAADRMQSILTKWKQGLASHGLSKQQLSPRLLEPFQIRSADVADKIGRRAAAWSKALPLLIMIWCLTGAFYPAVDLCAGEKERGTFETLLSSPASRTDIAIGKLFTVMIFSMATCLLNLISMGITSFIVLSRMGASPIGGPLASLEMPPTNSLFWLFVAIIPISALFSAVSLAAAAFARSSKEGQYYLVPLIMISMPLMVLPMLPTSKLELGTSLIPVTGLMLLLRSLIEGNYGAALQFVGPVCSVTLVCCWLAIRWVVQQFNSETVMFRASERFDVGRWLAQIFRQRGELPSVGHALLCVVTILVARFFSGFAISPPQDFLDFALQTTIILFATVAMPAILMAMVLTRRVDLTLKLRLCNPAYAAAAVLMAICLSPMFTWISSLVMQLYPPTESLGQMTKLMSGIMDSAPSLVVVLLVLAVVPALFEELAFRGFILGGWLSNRKPISGIVLTSLAFGSAHAVFQQSIMAFFVGLILGVIAWRTSSLIPCVLYHATHNTMSILLGEVPFANWGAFQWVVRSSGSQAVAFQIGAGLLLTITGLLLLTWMLRNELPSSGESKLAGGAFPGDISLLNHRHRTGGLAVSQGVPQ